eukprot:1553944-Rhodomonas_salina.1
MALPGGEFVRQPSAPHTATVPGALSLRTSYAMSSTDREQSGYRMSLRNCYAVSRRGASFRNGSGSGVNGNGVGIWGNGNGNGNGVGIWGNGNGHGNGNGIGIGR